MQNIKKLRWKCRRGMKEMDILFEHYLNDHYENVDAEHQSAFETLCDTQDPVVADYLFERSKPDNAAVNDIINIMRAYSIDNHR